MLCLIFESRFLAAEEHVWIHMKPTIQLRRWYWFSNSIFRPKIIVAIYPPTWLKLLEGWKYLPPQVCDSQAAHASLQHEGRFTARCFPSRMLSWCFFIHDASSWCLFVRQRRIHRSCFWGSSINNCSSFDGNGHVIQHGGTIHSNHMIILFWITD